MSLTKNFRQSFSQCHVRVGPMFSGKTEYLNHELTRLADSTTSRVSRISHVLDIRDTTEVDISKRVTSHSSSFKLSDKINVQVVNKLEDVDIEKFDVLGVDEAHFYDNLSSNVLRWLNHGKMVYVVGLDGLSSGKVCSGIAELLPYADSFTKITAYCEYCNVSGYLTPAIMSASKIRKDSDIQVGGAERYAPVCRNCHKLHNVN